MLEFGDRGVGRHGFLFHLLPGSTLRSPVLCQAWLPGSCVLRICCPPSDSPWPVLQAEGWVLHSWFQLGTRKLARSIFSPGFWRSQRSFILGGAGHSGTQLANTGLLDCRADRLWGTVQGQGGGGANMTCPSLGLGTSGDAARATGVTCGSAGSSTPADIGGQVWGGTCCLPPPAQALLRPNMSLSWGLFLGLNPGLEV